MKKLILTLIVFLFTVGCAALFIPPDEEIAKADYGSYPSNYEEIVKKHVTDYLLDPESAKFSNWKEPRKGWVRKSGSWHYGYKVCVYVNAKNRMGGYTGRKLTYVLIRNGNIIETEGGDYKYGTHGEEIVINLCK